MLAVRSVGRSITACLLFGLCFACRNDLENVAAVEVPRSGADRVTRGAEYFLTDAGKVHNILRAGRISEWTSEPQHTEIDDGLELVFLDSLGRPGSTLTARRGLILSKEKRMEVYENVVFVNAKGERLETEQLTWDQDSAQVRTDRAVRVKRGGDIIHGQGLVASEDFSQYKIRRITGELHVEDDDTLAAPAQEQRR